MNEIATLVVGIIVVAILIAIAFYQQNRLYKKNPSFVSYWNGIYTVEQYEVFRHSSHYCSYDYKIKNGKIVSVWEKPSKLALILITIVTVAVIPAMFIPDIVIKIKIVAILLFFWILLLIWILPYGLFNIRARRFLKKELSNGNICEV